MQNIHKTVSTTSRKFCSVPQCTSYTTKEVSLHKFPKDKHLLKKWQHILKINKTVSKYMFVCSKHFDEQDFFFGDIPQVYNATKRRRLKNNVIPTRNLPLTALDKKLNNLKPKSRRSRWLDKKILEQHVSKDLNEEVQNQIDIPNTFPLEENIHQQEVENISEPSTSEETNFSRNISTQTINFEYNFTELLSDDSKLNSFTGLPPRKKLKRTAIPTLNLPQNKHVLTKTTKTKKGNRKKIDKKIVVETIIVNAVDENICNNYSVIDNNSTTDSTSSSPVLGLTTQDEAIKQEPVDNDDSKNESFHNNKSELVLQLTNPKLTAKRESIDVFKDLLERYEDLKKKYERLKKFDCRNRKKIQVLNDELNYYKNKCRKMSCSNEDMGG